MIKRDFKTRNYINYRSQVPLLLFMHRTLYSMAADITLSALTIQLLFALELTGDEPIPSHTMKLIQKRFLQGSREFEIIDDAVQVRIKSGFKEEKLTVLLAMLNPEPVVNKPFLDFHSRVKADPLLSLYLDTPNTSDFNHFVDELKTRARLEYNRFAGLNNDAQAQGIAANSYEEPPDFSAPATSPARRKPVNPDSIDSSIKMLRQHLDANDIEPMLTALESLKADPENDICRSHLVNVFDNLGAQQGAVLTYAPYVGILLADVPLDY